jgi:hypothetical protein
MPGALWKNETWEGRRHPDSASAFPCLLESICAPLSGAGGMPLIPEGQRARPSFGHGTGD